MKPNPDFIKLPKPFWACDRSLSEKIGYTIRGKGNIRVPSIDEMEKGLIALDLNPSIVRNHNGNPTYLGMLLNDYFSFRANALNNHARINLMNKEQAEKVFDELHKQYKPKCPLPMNKQKGSKKGPAYMTGIVNMILEANIGEHHCDYDPRRLTTITKNGHPIRTMSRRIDGAFPSTINPIAVWKLRNTITQRRSEAELLMLYMKPSWMEWNCTIYIKTNESKFFII